MYSFNKIYSNLTSAALFQVALHKCNHFGDPAPLLHRARQSAALCHGGHWGHSRRQTMHDPERGDRHLQHQEIPPWPRHIQGTYKILTRTFSRSWWISGEIWAGTNVLSKPPFSPVVKYKSYHLIVVHPIWNRKEDMPGRISGQEQHLHFLHHDDAEYQVWSWPGKTKAESWRHHHGYHPHAEAILCQDVTEEVRRLLLWILVCVF